MTRIDNYYAKNRLTWGGGSVPSKQQVLELYPVLCLVALLPCCSV
jgi:hypothetical protein